MMVYMMEIQGDLTPCMTCEQVSHMWGSTLLNFNANIPKHLCAFINCIINGNKTFKVLVSRVMMAYVVRCKSFTITSVQ